MSRTRPTYPSILQFSPKRPANSLTRMPPSFWTDIPPATSSPRDSRQGVPVPSLMLAPLLVSVMVSVWASVPRSPDPANRFVPSWVTAAWVSAALMLRQPYAANSRYATCSATTAAGWQPTPQSTRRPSPSSARDYTPFFMVPTRYDQLFASMGAYTERVEKPEDIKPALERAFKSGKTSVIDVVVDPAIPSTTEEEQQPWNRWSNVCRAPWISRTSLMRFAQNISTRNNKA